MTNGSPGSFPSAALDWLAPVEPGVVLAIGRPSAVTANRLADLGSRVLLSDKSGSAVRATRRRYPSLQAVAAAPDALPFVPCSFDQVLVAQGLHLLPSGLVLDEFARVLAPGGRLAVLHTARDDSVPWVRRLATILREYDPDAMTGGAELYSVASIAASPHFPVVEHRSFRLWVPITRDGLLEMVSAAPRLSVLEQADSDRLLDEVGHLYDTSARAPEPLLLPYSVMCWRAAVDHSELSAAIRGADEGFGINFPW
ncbi:MAG: methyltransferase domain-containing protein [Propionicimonas sp.]|uniref:class I SAM-dependent methyltransferase n=1 Tax=Propionicimonas sp. TaxID=1955623 RepID=UPI003D148A4B